MNFVTTIKNDKVLKASLLVTIALLLVYTTIIFFTYNLLPPFIPLLNNLSWGDERLVDKNYIVALPIIGIAMTVINFVMSGWVYKKNTLVARILGFNTLLFALLGLLAFIQIVLLVL